MKDYKLTCKVCAWVGRASDTYNMCGPYDAHRDIQECPLCESAGTLILACDEQGCHKVACCGMPTSLGYRHTCREHQPEHK